MYVCMCIYIYIYTHTCTFTFTSTYTYIHIHIHVCMYIYVYTYTYTYIHVYVYVYTYTHIYIAVPEGSAPFSGLARSEPRRHVPTEFHLSVCFVSAKQRIRFRWMLFGVAQWMRSGIFQ